MDLESRLETTQPTNTQTLENQVELAISQLDTTRQRITRMALACGCWTPKQITAGNFLPQMLQRTETAVHELGHGDSTKGLGGEVLGISVEPESSRLGVTHIRLPFRGSLIEHYTRLMATFFGGRVAEDRLGLSHEGCGSDMGHIESIASSLAARFPLLSASSLIEDAHSLACQVFSSTPTNNLIHRALSLARQGSALAA